MSAQLLTLLICKRIIAVYDIINCRSGVLETTEEEEEENDDDDLDEVSFGIYVLRYLSCTCSSAIRYKHFVFDVAKHNILLL